MKMDSPLVTHARQNVWCATNQDFQHHINLPRITPARGVLKQYPVLWDVLLVPPTATSRDYFHFYQIGQLPSSKFDFIIDENVWVNYIDLNLTDNILIDVYLVSGAIVPRDHIWITKLYNNNIIVAIKNNFKIDYGVCDKSYFAGVAYKDKFTLDNNQAIIRLYSNAYFNKVSYIENGVDPSNPIRIVYKRVETLLDYNAFMSQCISIETEFGVNGLGVYYEDGFVVNKPSGFKDSYVGKYFGFMWDESFKLQHYFDLKHLPAFISEKSRGVRKYLLVNDGVYDIIDYHDDVDIYIVNKVTGKGVYYNRNALAGITMVTHNSYAVNAEIVEGYIQAHSFLGKIEDCSIRIMVRHGGRDNGLLNQKNRIEELYRLSYEQILDAHVDTPSLVPVWRAAELEKSSYVNLMSAPSTAINEQLVIDAYGYNSLCTSFANPLATVSSNQFLATQITKIPDRMTNLGNRSVFCYNSSGVMIGYYQDKGVSPFITIPQTISGVETVECINTQLSETDVQAWVNINVSSNDLEQYGFRCYVCSEVSGEISNVWEDVTGSSLYTYTKSTHNTPATIVWKWSALTAANLYPAVRSNKIMNIYKWSKPANVPNDGCLEFVVKANQQWGNVKERRPLGLPPGNVDVFANGLSLIRDVDYVMRWPTIVITNRDVYRMSVLNVVIRSYGFADPRTDKPFVSKDTGFVKDGMLSINGVYDIRNNKCVRVVVDNKLVNVNSKNYGEYLIGDNYTDGKPYSISDYVIPLDNLLKANNTWDLYEETLIIDETVSNYLTSRLPEQPTITPIVVTTRWPVISPVVSAILHAFQTAFNFDTLVPDNFTNEDIERWFKPFKWLLDYDPAHLNVDKNYFRIEPHAKTTVMQITQKQYEFLEWIITLYLNDRVDLTSNVTIG